MRELSRVLDVALRLGVLGCVMGASLKAYAQSEPRLEIDARLVRRIGLPAGFDPTSAAVVSSPTDVVWAGVVGVEREARCVVLSIQEDGATALTYRHLEGPTVCTSVALGERGEIFVRGSDPTIMNNAVPSGFTALLDPSGSVRWAIDDGTLVGAKSRSEGGTGDFIGAYGGISNLMAYNAEQRALMAFSVGSLRFGLRATPVTQAHIVEVDSGRLRRTGQGFGSNGAGLVNRLLVEPNSPNYLLYTKDTAGLGGEFYLYDGRSSISTTRPFDVTWKSRVLLALDRHVQRELVALLWVDGPATNERVRLSMMSASGAPRFEVDLDSELTDSLGASVELGRPNALWLGDRYTLVQYAVGTLRYVRVLDSGSGELLGGFYLEDLIGMSNMLGALRVGEQGELRLVRWSTGSSSLEEFVWTLVDTQGPGEEMGDAGADMGEDMATVLPDADLVEGSITGSEFCALASPAHSPPVPFEILLCGVGVALWRRRTREA